MFPWVFLEALSMENIIKQNFSTLSGKICKPHQENDYFIAHITKNNVAHKNVFREIMQSNLS